MRLKDVMTTDVITVTPGHSIRHTIKIMLDHGISGVPVLESNGSIVGILTAGDLLRRSELGTDTFGEIADDPEPEREYDFIKAYAWCVGDVMTSPAVCVTEDYSLRRVANLFLKRGIKRAPVMHEAEMIGIVSRRDLMRAILDSPQDEEILGDERLYISVIARLKMAENLIGDLPKASVHHGVITLSGQVRSQPIKDLIRVIAEGIRGVTGVTDAMTLAHDETALPTIQR